MRAFHTTSARLTVLGRCTAWTGVVVVMLLTWLSVDPVAHAWLHEHKRATASTGCGSCSGHGHEGDRGDLPQSEDDDGCAIVRFAQGHVDSVVGPVLVATPLARHEILVRPDVVTRGGTVDHDHPPACGPPVVLEGV